MLFSFLLFTLIMRASASVDCIYRYPSPLEMQSRGVLEPLSDDGQPMGGSGRHRRSASSHQLRIAPYYAQSFNNEPNSAELKSKIVDKAIAYWESVLKIKTGRTRIRLSRHCNSANVTYVSSSGSTPQYYCQNGCKAKTTCGHTDIPSAHLDYCREMKNGAAVTTGTQGDGVDADFILYISADTSPSCSNHNGILGYAAHCQQEPSLDRPIAGYINFCPGKLKTSLGYLQQSLFTAQHEILHALGFAVSLYAYFRDADGEPLTPRKHGSNIPALGYLDDSGSFIFKWSSNVTVNKTYSWMTRSGMKQKSVTLFKLPNVLREARNHFNCSQLEGVELEDQGENGVALTHWEKRLLENELMTGTYTHEHVISRLTLAFMQDTGWYEVDYSKGQKLHWGKNLGCSFATQSCMAWMQAHPTDPSPYCQRLDKTQNTISTTSCTVSRRSVGYCVLEKYSVNLHEQHQYFSSLPGVSNSEVGKYGGGVYLADYCPFVQGFNWRSNQKVTRTTDCQNSANNAGLMAKNNPGLEKHGLSSMCLATNSDWRVNWCRSISPLKIFGSGCYEYECHSEYGLIIKVDQKSYQCLSAGITLNISVTSKKYLHRGGLRCPSCADVCDSCPSRVRRYTPAHSIWDTSIPCQDGTQWECYPDLIIATVAFALVFPFF